MVCNHEACCTLNHKGSSPAIEAEGALILWRRSVSRLGMSMWCVMVIPKSWI